MDLLKYILLICLAPIWLPFVKELWQEFTLAMRGDGGIFNPPPSPIDRQKLDAELAEEEISQVNQKLPTFTRPGVGEPRGPLPGGGPQTGIVRRPFTQQARSGFKR